MGVIADRLVLGHQPQAVPADPLWLRRPPVDDMGVERDRAHGSRGVPYRFGGEELLFLGCGHRNMRPGASLDTSPAPPEDSPVSLFRRFLKFGALAWGGPAAQIAMIKRECVDEQGWVSEDAFKRILAVYQVLPGPEAHELCVYFGRMRGGRLGALLAGLGFMLPGFLLMLGLSALYVEAEISESFDELFYGLAAGVAAIVARALVRLGSSFITDRVLAVVAVAAFALTAFAPVSPVVVLAGGGIAYELWTNAVRYSRRLSTISPLPAAVAIVAGAVTVSLTAEIFLECLKAGLLTFGGAFTVIPFLQ